MLLITVQEWLGPGRKMTAAERERTEVRLNLIGFVTRLTLPEAIIHLNKYESAFNEKYLLGFTMRIVAVSIIDDLDNKLINIGGMELIEDKPTSVIGFD